MISLLLSLLLTLRGWARSHAALQLEVLEERARLLAQPAPHDAPAPQTPRLPVHPDHARALLHIANHRGQAQARLTLHPAELGGVER